MQLAQICQEVIKICQKVGDFIAQEAQNFDKQRIEYKGTNDLVSYVDKTAEKKLIEALDQILPNAGYITEENPDNKVLTDKEFHWVIDPLDGTTNFIHQIPIYSISIGLMQGNDVVLGVVYAIQQKEMFYAWKNGGAFCNQKPIQVSHNTELSKCLLATGFPYRYDDKISGYLNILNELMPQTHGLRRMGSAAIDLAYIASGRFDLFFEYNLKPWDVAAGVVLIKEAGGVITNFSNIEDYLFTGELLTGTPAIHALLQPLIQKSWV